MTDLTSLAEKLKNIRNTKLTLNAKLFDEIISALEAEDKRRKEAKTAMNVKDFPDLVWMRFKERGMDAILIREWQWKLLLALLEEKEG